MIYQGCNGTVMLSCESEVVRNNFAYSKLERFLIDLSAKYGLGEVLFRERNPKNNNSTDSFYIRSPKEWSLDKEFKVGDLVVAESQAFIEKENIESEIGLCCVVVSSRY